MRNRFNVLALLPAVLCICAFTQSSTVKIVVKDPTGAVVPSANVQLIAKQPERVEFKQKTDKEGTVSVLLNPGTYDLAVMSPGFKRFSREVSVSNDSKPDLIKVVLQVGDSWSGEIEQKTTVDIADDKLVTTNPVKVLVRDPSGAAIAGAKVLLVSEAGQCNECSAITDAKGAASLNPFAGKYELKVTAAGFTDYAKEVAVNPGDNLLEATLTICCSGPSVEIAADYLPGTWKLNVNKSKMPPESETIVISIDKSSYKISIDTKSSNGTELSYGSVTKMDGSVSKVTQNDGKPMNEEWRVNRESPNAFVISSMPFHVVTRYTVSADGKTLTKTEVSSDLVGGKIVNGRITRVVHVLVYDKVD